MSSKRNTEIKDKKKARDDALQFLETLSIGDEVGKSGSVSAQNVPEATESDKANVSVAPKDASSQGDGKQNSKNMLQFIDDLTESAKKSMSSERENEDSTTREQAENNEESAAGPKGNAGGGWSWSGIWGQAAALVEQNEQLKSGIGKLKDSIDHVRNTDASKALESRMKTLVNQEQIAKFGGDLKKSLDTVIETIAPPIQDHEMFKVHLINNIQDDNMEGLVYRTMDAVFDFHGCGEITVKSDAKALAEAPEISTKRGDTFTLPKGFDGGYGAAVTSIQYIQRSNEGGAKAKAGDTEEKSTEGIPGESKSEKASVERDGSPLFYRSRKTELFLAIQPFSVIPIEDQGFLCLCIVLRDPSRGWTVRTFSQMLPLSCWAKPHDQIVDADVDVSLGSTVTMAADSVVQRKQEMNEECLYEAVMLAVKTLSNEYLTMRPKNTEIAMASKPKETSTS